MMFETPDKIKAKQLRGQIKPSRSYREVPRISSEKKAHWSCLVNYTAVLHKNIIALK